MNFAANLTVVITGLLGSGKTSACNFFCNQQLKNSSNLSISHQTAYFITNIEERSVKFIDTPGFCDSRLSEPQTFSELAHALILTRSGVHAFGMVLDVTSRFLKPM